MLYALLSPAKRLDFAPVAPGVKATAPALMADAAKLAKRAKAYSVADLRRLMDLSPALAELNYQRFQAFDLKNGGGTKPAMFAFAGDVYMGLQAKTLSADDIKFAQDHIGILSGLYGLLRPLDGIQPYRLEMGTAVNTDAGEDLYDYWRDTLTARLNALTAKMKKPVIVNLASEEYWRAVDPARLKAPVVQCVFKELKNGKASIVAFFAKKARGLMARHIIRTRAEAPDDLKGFDLDGYAFAPAASTETQLVFLRRAK